jgi:hypothetical protein
MITFNKPIPTAAQLHDLPSTVYVRVWQNVNDPDRITHTLGLLDLKVGQVDQGRKLIGQYVSTMPIQWK